MIIVNRGNLRFDSLNDGTDLLLATLKQAMLGQIKAVGFLPPLKQIDGKGIDCSESNRPFQRPAGKMADLENNNGLVRVKINSR